MRKVLVTVVACLCLVSLASPAYCEGDAMKKLGRGVCNMLTFPLEIPRQMAEVNRTDGPMAGITWGPVKGVGLAIGRLLVGTYETATFPIPCPEYYNPILTDPEFMLDDMSL